MGFHMLLYSLPKIEGMELKEILDANSCLKIIEEEQNETYEKVKMHIKSYEDLGISCTLLTEVAYWAKDYGLHFLFLDYFQLVDEYMPYYKITKEQLQACYAEFMNGRRHSPNLPDTNQTFPPIDRTRNILETLLLNFSFDTQYLVYIAG